MTHRKPENRPDSAEAMLLGYMKGFGVIEDLLKASYTNDTIFKGNLAGVKLAISFFEIISRAIPKITGCLLYEYRQSEVKLTTAVLKDQKAIDSRGKQCSAGKMLQERLPIGTTEPVPWCYKEELSLLEELSEDAGQHIFHAFGMVLAHELLQYDIIMVCYSDAKESAFFSQDKNFFTMFVNILLLTLSSKEKRLLEREKRVIEKGAYKKSAHTFEKCYNTPIRNMCFLLRQFIHPYNDRARQLTFGIQDYIDLWANHHSANITLGATASKQWIECFKLEKIKRDLKNFSRHMLTMRLNDLFDDCYKFKGVGDEKENRQDIGIQRELGGKEDRSWKSRELQSAWDGQLRVNDVVNVMLEIDGEILLFGIRPLFRVVMLNMLQNAIEALDLFSIYDYNNEKGFGQDERRPEIKFIVTQTEQDTTIIVANYGKIVPRKMVDRLEAIFDKAKHGRLPRYPTTGSGPETTKSGTGSGVALWEAAYYFSCIKVKQQKKFRRGWIELNAGESELTELKIKLPFGSEQIERYKGLDLEKRQTFHEVQFDWGRDERLTKGN